MTEILLVLPWLIVLLCIAAEAFFAASEIAIVSADLTRMSEAAEAGSASARRVLWFRDHPERLFGTTLLGTNISMITASAVASLTLTSWFPERGGWLALLVMAPLVLIAGELLPKTLAQAHAQRTAARLAEPLYWVHRLFTPLIYLVERFTGLLYRVLDIPPEATRPPFSRQDLEAVVTADVVGEGDIDPDERAMISRIFTFGAKHARDCMVPLGQVVAVPLGATVREAVEVVAREGFSRLPVYRDRIDDIVGVLHHLDLLGAEGPQVPIEGLMHPPFFVPELQDVDDILVLLKRAAASAAIVVDEFGGAVGLITLEDVLEEIVGDIVDEFDEAGTFWRSGPEGGFLLSGRAPVEQVNRVFRLNLPEDAGYETLAGYVLTQLRRIPTAGTEVPIEGPARLVVRRASARAVQELLLTGVPGPKA